MIIKFDEETTSTEVYDVKDNNPRYKEALKRYQNALETNNPMKIDIAYNHVEVTVADISYKKGFHDGMNFILNAMAGKEVIDL